MNLIAQLAQTVGFHASYYDAFGNHVFSSEQAYRSLLSAMGYNLDNDETIKESIKSLQEDTWRNILPNVHIAKLEEQNHGITVSLLAKSVSTFSWQITMENGDVINGEQLISELTPQGQQNLNGNIYVKYQFILPELLSKYSPQVIQGYHQLSITHGNITDTCALIYAPQTCYQPSDAANYKMWGYAAQLYSLTSENNWGIGDFGDLLTLIETTAKQGVSAIGLNPLHPLYQNNPEHCSPYSPSSRSLLNPIYIDISQVANYQTCAELQKLISQTDFAEKLQQVKTSELIDYKGVAQLKFPALAILFDDFIKNGENKLQQSFNTFKENLGETLLNYCTFEALYEYFRAQNANSYSWHDWPNEYQNPQSSAVKAFQQTYAKRINYFAYLQWLAHTQLSLAQQNAKQAGMAVGLYLDLAVGCSGSGVDTWSSPDIYVNGAAIGAPPDMMNTLGQNWGLTPINPVALQQQGYLTLVNALRSNMQYAGAIRIDHILGLLRQYWVAPGMKANEGIYINYPIDDIFRIIALESRRSQCIVIGEDLGTVPEGFGDIMRASGLLSYKVLYFENWQSGLFKRPQEYPELAMVTVSTHDLATLASWWTGRDLQWRQQLALYPNEEMGEAERNGRVQQRKNLLMALDDQNLIDLHKAPSTEPPIMSNELNIATQLYLASTASCIQLIPLEDALMLTEQVNVPGTVDEHPNWRRKLNVAVDKFTQQESVATLANAMQKARPKAK